MVPKFRAWDKEENLWIKVASLVFDEEGEMWYLGPVMDDFNPVYYENELGKTWEIMQSTGLKDKNGVEIFEGDVVSLTEGECSYSGIVVRDYYEFYIKGIGPRDCFDFQDVSNTFDGTTSLEVTTNIYKNPELLEKANEN